MRSKDPKKLETPPPRVVEVAGAVAFAMAWFPVIVLSRIWAVPLVQLSNPPPRANAEAVGSVLVTVAVAVFPVMVDRMTVIVP
jgi:hypothetical protein